MPYILHLPHVNVTEEGRIESRDGVDIRILLRRLATRLTVAWENIPANTGYNLKQVMIHAIPVEYKLLPEDKDSYPSLLDQYSTIQLSDISDSGQYSCWLPSVARGESANATSLYHRTKANAPSGSAYITFISQHKTDNKKKLNYRVYLGGGSSKDFNLYDNTNYIYKVTMDHRALPVDDKRVTIIDPIRASKNNNNLVPTANCFMVVPGGAFCFNPYTYYINGAPAENTTLREWCDNSNGMPSTPIKSVKVLWQTLENEDLGDPVLGVVNNYDAGTANDDHSNIVELVDGNSFTNARVYCRVAPNTTGGSGVIAVYDDVNGNGNILWSWHVWVTDYAPSAVGTETVLEENKRKFALTNGSTKRLPIMDRCLGAYEGYVEIPKESILQKSRAGGFYYQFGRKDPLPGSYTSVKVPNKYVVTLDRAAPPKHWLNRYLPDGVSWVIPEKRSRTSLRQAYKEPQYQIEGVGNKGWCSDSSTPAWGSTKTIHDPCPAGWRVPSKDEIDLLKTLNTSVPATAGDDGGVLLRYDGNSSHFTYIRFTGYPASPT